MEPTDKPETEDQPGDARPAAATEPMEPVDPGQPSEPLELANLQDKYLRLAAEYENFRKRTARERTEMWNRAQADLVARMLDALDDLDRVSQLDPDQTVTKDVIDGVELVERKLFRDLEAAGLERVGARDDPFDPNIHEAIGTLPAETAEQDQSVGSVLQPGYRFGGALVRPARVQVRMWQGEPASEDR